MQPTHYTRSRRCLISLFVLSTVAAAAAAAPAYGVTAAGMQTAATTKAYAATATSVHTSAAIGPHDAPTGADLWHLDTATGHYTQASGGLTSLQLYNTTVGIPDQAGWRLRDPHLGVPAQDGTVAPLDLPFGLRLATRLGGPVLATLTNEDGVSLGLTLASIAGTAPAAIAGQVGGETITYTAPVAASPSDVAVRATTFGLSVRLVLHSAAEGGPFIFGLALDASAQVAQDPSGAIRVTRPVTSYDDAGVPHVIQQTEYIAYPPAVADESVPSGPSVAGPAGLALDSAAGQPAIALSVDPTWLHDIHRTFPVTIDLPIATAYAAVATGWAGTVDSCAPAAPAAQGEIVVGVSGACSAHGLLSFDVSALPYDTPIQSAVLRLYAPRQAGASAVQVYANVPPARGPWQPTSWDQPSWATAPALAPGAAIAGTGVGGSWQQWDITALVRRWVRNHAHNGGLTLVSNGPPVSFTAPWGATPDDTPANAPVLEISYGTAQGAMLPLDDAAPVHIGSNAYIYGVGGTFITDGSCTGHACNGYMAVHADANDQTSGVGGRYMRFGVTLSCGAVGSGTYSSAYSIMSNAYSQGLTPIVQFGPNSACLADYNGWYSQVYGFIAYIPTARPLPWTYYEIGNEPNYNGAMYPSGYAASFMYAARAVEDAYSAHGDGGSYAALTGGMLDPSANTTTACQAPGSDLNINDAYTAIQDAEHSMGVPASHLGVAVHPYHYNTAEATYWRNYYHEYPGWAGYNGPAGVCGALDSMVNLWTSWFPGLPVVFTEVDWSTQPTSEPRCDNVNGCAGTYLVDLLTWLNDHNCAGHQCDSTGSPLRVMWFRGADADLPLGLYDYYGNDKSIALVACANGGINNGSSTLANDYYYLRHGACY